MRNIDWKNFLGSVPTKVSADFSISEELDCGSYIRKKIDFACEPDERIPSYLCIPKGPGPHPAVYCHHQHGGNWQLGKSESMGLAGDPDLAYGRELAELGYVVLAPDAIAFEERNLTDGSGNHNFYELTSRLVQGKTLLAKVLHDVAAGLDLLDSLSCVDSQRLGFIGHSYGGRMAIWAAAFDKRIKASVSNCGCISYQDSLSPQIGIQMEFCIPGIMGKLEIIDLVRSIAPRALYISATDDDKWSLGAEALGRNATKDFPSGQLQYHVYPGKHSFTFEMRNAAYEFLKEHL